MKHRCLLLLAVLVLLPSQGVCATTASSSHDKKIVLIAGKKSHPPAMHEYLKTVRLLKVMLDNSPNLRGIKTEIHFDGWPEDPSTLNDADVIMTISDGQDGPDIGYPVPFLTEERMAIMERQMKRGCGFITFHFSTFAPDQYGPKILEWGGGYFDWQDETGRRNWYSAIKTLNTRVEFPSLKHPICKGVQPYRAEEEFYYNVRFNENDVRLTPILNVPELESDRKYGGVVAWAVDRADGGRGFATTTGHYYGNWKNDDYRKLILNGVVWAAGADVPEGGVESRFYTDREVTQLLYGTTIKGLILTGHDPHNSQESTPVLRKAIEKDHRTHLDVTNDIEDLSRYDLRDYDFLVLNYCIWTRPKGLSERSKKALTDYLSEGGGLLVLPLASAAFHPSLPGAAESDWPEYRKIVRRVWDHPSDSGQDRYGTFQVEVTNTSHEITQAVKSFQTTDELFYNLKGDEPIELLLSARSQVTGKEEPLAWTYPYGKGRVFQTVLGHDARALSVPELQTILMRAAAWAAMGHGLWNDL